MKRDRLYIFITILTFIFLSAGLPYAQERGTTGSSVHVPRPRLIKPASEVVDISDEKGILFKWSLHEAPSGGRKKYRFQLYEGYERYEQNLIFKAELEWDTSEIFIEKDKFKNGSVYTWSLRQRGYSGNWGSRSFHSFKVIM